MTRALRERVDSRDAKREPPYRSSMELTVEQQRHVVASIEAFYARGD